jgi:hypothetical protein
MSKNKMTFIFFELQFFLIAFSFLRCPTTYWKYALKQGNRIGVHFIKYDIQGVFLKCAEILPTRLFDNVED